jgi:hypothetical protein
MITRLERQNEVIIELLARSTLGIEYIEGVVTGGKKQQRRDKFVRAYNSLDGNKTVTQIAEIIGGSRQAASKVLQLWAIKGVVYDVGEEGRPMYVGLLKLS